MAGSGRASASHAVVPMSIADIGSQPEQTSLNGMSKAKRTYTVVACVLVMCLFAIAQLAVESENDAVVGDVESELPSFIPKLLPDPVASRVSKASRHEEQLEKSFGELKNRASRLMSDAIESQGQADRLGEQAMQHQQVAHSLRVQAKSLALKALQTAKHAKSDQADGERLQAESRSLVRKAKVDVQQFEARYKPVEGLSREIKDGERKEHTDALELAKSQIAVQQLAKPGGDASKAAAAAGDIKHWMDKLNQDRASLHKEQTSLGSLRNAALKKSGNGQVGDLHPNRMSIKAALDKQDGKAMLAKASKLRVAAKRLAKKAKSLMEQASQDSKPAKQLELEAQLMAHETQKKYARAKKAKLAASVKAKRVAKAKLLANRLNEETENTDSQLGISSVERGEGEDDPFDSTGRGHTMQSVKQAVALRSRINRIIAAAPPDAQDLSASSGR